MCKFHEELHNAFSSPGIIRMMKTISMRWAGHTTQMGKQEMHIKPLGKTRHGCESNINIDVRIGTGLY